MPCVCRGDPARLVHLLAWLLGLVSWSLVSGWLLLEAVTIAAALGALHLYRAGVWLWLLLSSSFGP